MDGCHEPVLDLAMTFKDWRELEGVLPEHIYKPETYTIRNDHESLVENRLEMVQASSKYRSPCLLYGILIILIIDMVGYQDLLPL